jgi:hypothetical protein
MKFFKIYPPQLNWTMHWERGHLQSFLGALSSQFCVVHKMVNFTALRWGCSGCIELLELKDYTSFYWEKKSGDLVQLAVKIFDTKNGPSKWPVAHKERQSICSRFCVFAMMVDLRDGVPGSVVGNRVSWNEITDSLNLLLLSSNPPNAMAHTLILSKP